MMSLISKLKAFCVPGGALLLFGYLCFMFFKELEMQYAAKDMISSFCVGFWVVASAAFAIENALEIKKLIK